MMRSIDRGFGVTTTIETLRWTKWRNLDFLGLVPLVSLVVIFTRSEIAVCSRRVMPVRMCVCFPHLGIFRFNSNLIEMSRYLVVSRNI